MKPGILLPSCRTQSSRQTTVDIALAAEGIGFDPGPMQAASNGSRSIKGIPAAPGRKILASCCAVRNAGMESTLTHSHVQNQGKREHAICPLMTQFAAEVA